MKEDYQKSPKNVTSFLFPDPTSFYRNNDEKGRVPGTSYQSLFRLRNKFRTFFSLVIHHLATF